MNLLPPTALPAWQKLIAQQKFSQGIHMRDQFAAEPDRFKRFSLRQGSLLLDYSKNRISDRSKVLLLQLAREAGLNQAIKAMFTGQKVNPSENRAALHIALRHPNNTGIEVDGKDIMPNVHRVLAQMGQFIEQLHSGQWRGYTGKAIQHIVNIGIGGSDLGPQMVVHALKPYWQSGLTPHFVANIDAADISDTLSSINSETTLFIIASKSFTTKETMANAETARAWFLNQAHTQPEDIKKHFVAVSTKRDLVTAFGIDPSNMFEFWDWVGGRYSLWSAIGLPIALMIGMKHFQQLLAGAHEMDLHFRDAPFEQNMPVIMAMLGIWYRDFYHAASHAVLPYDHHLRKLPAYLQQSDMESSGKCISVSGKYIKDYDTGPIVWGAAGANGQHAFYQLLHQGTQLVPADFILPITSHYATKTGKVSHHQSLKTYAIAQTEALMAGRPKVRVEASKIDPDLVSHCTFLGNRPTNTILIDKVTPHSLGSLIALYEHKIYAQGVIWRVNSFDQWGVELGKKLAEAIEPELSGQAATRAHDCSTAALINICRDGSLP